MSLLRTPWFTLVEVQVGATATQSQTFQEQEQLTSTVDQQIRILGMEAYTSDVITNGPSGNAIATVAEMQKAMVTLIDDDMQKVFKYPVLALNRISTPPAAGTSPSAFDLQLFTNLHKIAWTKCKIEFTVPPAGAPYSFLFGVHYEKLIGEMIKTA